MVIVIQFANIVLGDLVRGNRFSPAPTATMGLGTDPTDAFVDAADETASDDVDAPADRANANTDDDTDTKE